MESSALWGILPELCYTPPQVKKLPLLGEGLKFLNFLEAPETLGLSLNFLIGQFLRFRGSW